MAQQKLFIGPNLPVLGTFLALKDPFVTALGLFLEHNTNNTYIMIIKCHYHQL